MNDHGTSTPSLDGPAISTAVPVTRTDDGSIACYEGVIPSLVETELPKVHNDIHSTLAQLRIYGGLDDVTHTYVARRHGEVAAIFLLHCDGDAVRVINEGMAIDDVETGSFAHYLFSTWPSVQTISFHAVQASIEKLKHPHQRYACTASIVLPLPSSVDEYLSSLGKNMRRNLKRYGDRLRRDFPTYRFDVYEKDAVQEQHVRAIMNLNRARIAGKNKSYAIDNEEDSIVALAKTTGLAGVATIDGKVMSGAVGYLVGKNYFFKIIAHDPAYNDYSAGILCTYQMICACIERGCAEYNFMWNEYEYKFALGARPRSLEHVIVYRSRLQMLMHSRMAIGAAISRYRYRLSTLLDKAGKPEELSRTTRMAVDLMNGLRKAKRFAQRLVAQLRHD